MNMDSPQIQVVLWLGVVINTVAFYVGGGIGAH